MNHELGIKGKILILLIFFLFIFLPKVSQAAMRVWVDSDLVKIRQTGDPVGSQQNLSLQSAKNEFEPFQIFIFAEGENLSNVDVSLTNFTDGAGHTIDDIYIYKEFYIDVTTPSRADYKTGLWPDALLPKVDRYYHEQRNTFPFSVSSGNTQGVWVDVGTTADTPAGTYTAVYTVTAAGKSPINGTITFTVWNFALPSTPTLKSFMPVFAYDLDKGHYGSSQGDTWVNNMRKLYYKALMYHKLGLQTNNNDLWFTNIDGSGHVTSWTDWDNYFGDILDGTIISSGPLAGTKAAALTIEFGNNMTGRDASQSNWINYLQDWWDHFSAKGWDPRNKLYLYTVDEPNSDTWSYRGGTYTGFQVDLMKCADINSVTTGGAAWKNCFVTSRRRTELSSPGSPYTSLDTTGIYMPVTGYYTYRMPWCDSSCQTARTTYPNYPNFTNRDHMGYLSNDHSHDDSCSIQGGIGCVDNAPDLMLETPPVLTRGYFWIQWFYRVHGFLYYDTTAFYDGAAPYNSVWSIYHGNGDGILFYPGVPDKTGRSLPASTPAIGGIHDIPIESIRLKLIREGIEDREYMEILRNLGALDYADSQTDSIFSSLTDPGPYYAIKSDINVLLSARQNMAEKIVQLSGGPPPDTTPPAAPTGVTVQ